MWRTRTVPSRKIDIKPLVANQQIDAFCNLTWKETTQTWENQAKRCEHRERYKVERWNVALLQCEFHCQCRCWQNDKACFSLPSSSSYWAHLEYSIAVAFVIATTCWNRFGETEGFSFRYSEPSKIMYSLVQWNWFSDDTVCTWISCIQWRQRTNFTAPGCMCTNIHKLILFSELTI